LSANDFLRSNSVIHYTREGMATLASDVQYMAAIEGLTGHGVSITARVVYDQKYDATA
jgi:histidinol dehydrogenase